MRILGIAGLILALAIVGYLVASYLQGAGSAQQALRAVPGAPATGPVDPTKRGLEQRLGRPPHRVGGRQPHLAAPPAVGGVAEQRVAGLGEVDPDLMRPACLREYLEKSKTIQALKSFPSCDRYSPFSCPSGHPFPPTRVSPNGRVNETFILDELSIDKSEIDFIDGAGFKLFSQLMKSFVIFGNDHDSRSILIQPMDNSRPQDTVDPSEVFTMIKKGVDQCARRISVGGMNDHSRRLVNHDQRRVLIKNIERKRLGLE